MGWPRRIALTASAIAAAGAAFAYRSYRADMADADRAWARLAQADDGPVAKYDPSMVADLPEIARRYFAHAIEPGTPLYGRVELRMSGTFLLGDKASFRSFDMEARQMLAPGTGFVWVPRMRSGPMIITGSDALVEGKGWTRFWMMGLMRVANAETSPDLVRSAQFRSVVEGMWAPATLLPQNGVRWEQAGPDSATLTFERIEPNIVIEMTLSPEGAVREAVGQRWSNANPEQRFRLQTFGGTIEAEGTFGGFTIPTDVRIGNHYGTADYLPFFQARVTSARHF